MNSLQQRNPPLTNISDDAEEPIQINCSNKIVLIKKRTIILNQVVLIYWPRALSNFDKTTP
jgi:hypothetical protein